MFRDFNLNLLTRIRRGSTILSSHLDKLGCEANYEVYMLIPSVCCEMSTSNCLKLTSGYENEIFLATVIPFLGNSGINAESDEKAEDVREEESNDKGVLFLNKMLKLGEIYKDQLPRASYYRPLLEEVFKEYAGLSDSRAEQMAFVKRRVLAVEQNVKVRTHNVSFDYYCLIQSMICYT